MGRTLYGGGNQLYASQVRKLAPAGVLGLVGAAIDVSGGECSEFLCDAQGRIFLMVASDSTVEREAVLVDNSNSPIVTNANTPIRAVLRGGEGERVSRTPITVGGREMYGVRVKDLPQVADDDGFFVRDSEAGGTVKADKIDAATLDEIWNETEEETDG